jgi:hypothetical protein
MFGIPLWGCPREGKREGGRGGWGGACEHKLRLHTQRARTLGSGQPNAISRRGAVHGTPATASISGICHDIYQDIYTDILYHSLSPQDGVCFIARYPNNPNPPEALNLATDLDMSWVLLGRVAVVWPAAAAFSVQRPRNAV